MIIIYLLTALMFIVSLQTKIKLKHFTVLFLILSAVYIYYSGEILQVFNTENTSIYEELFIKYFPYFMTATISLYIRFELEKSQNSIEELKEKLNKLDDKIHRILELSSKVRKEKREIEKRLISENKESIKIRESISEISNFNIEKIQNNILNYFLRLVPSAKMSFYKFEDEDFTYRYSTYENDQQKILSNELISYVKTHKKNIQSSLNYTDTFDEKVLISIKLNENKFFGLVIIEDLDFYDLNNLTIKNLSYFVDLLSLQIQNALIYKKQKETSFAYNDKNIYNLDFLKKMIVQELSIAKRHGINSSIINMSSQSFKNLDKTQEDELFEEMEGIFQKIFRTTDILFYNHKNNDFIFLLPLTAIGNIENIISKISFISHMYDVDITTVEINETSQTQELYNTLGFD